MWKLIDKYFDFIAQINQKLDEDKYGKQKKLYISILIWYILGLITFKAHPTIFLFVGMCCFVYQQLFNKKD